MDEAIHDLIMRRAAVVERIVTSGAKAEGEDGAAPRAGGGDRPAAAGAPPGAVPARRIGAHLARIGLRHDSHARGVRPGRLRRRPGGRLFRRRPRAFRRADPAARLSHPGAGDRRGERRVRPPPRCCRCRSEGEPRADAWWTTLLHKDEPRIYVIARLPFWTPRPEGAPRVQALLVGNVPPDPSGDDRSLLGLEVAVDVSRARLGQALTAAGFDAGTHHPAARPRRSDGPGAGGCGRFRDRYRPAPGDPDGRASPADRAGCLRRADR